jgi:hypothetical protein
LIRDLCVRIQSALDADPKLKQIFSAVQVKEKYGGLRFYVNGGDDNIENMITQAEQTSESTCELCGKHGETLNKHGWLQTLCTQCSGGEK